MIRAFLNWIKERKEWVLFFTIFGLLLLLSFSAGFLIGKQELSPIIIEKQVDEQ